MPLLIKEINVQNLGPIRKFSMHLGIFNLIYSHNEKGKTYLVEFLIRSLFRNVRHWKLRAQKGSGKVRVEGLPGGVVDFSPSSSKKLEDFWDKSNVGLPPDLSKLLVVKGAKVDIDDVEGGADKVILKRYLSSKEILDNIEKRISKTIQGSKVENKTIIGPKKGENKTREEIEEKLRIINQLFDQIERVYSGGYRRTLADEKQKLQDHINQLLKAKQYLAFKVDQQIKNLKRKRNRIDDAELQIVKSKLLLYKQKINDYTRKEASKSEADSRSKHYEWLQAAHEVYQNLMEQESGRPHPIFLILSIIMVLLLGVFAFFKMPTAAALLFGGFILFGWLYIKKYRTMQRRASEDEEMERLESQFKNKFGQVLTGLPLILEILQKKENDYSNAQLLKEQLSDDQEDLESLQVKISDQIFNLTGERKDPETWKDTLQMLNRNIQNLDSQIREKELYLAKLGVDPSDYQTEKPDVEYSKQQFDELQDNLSHIKKQIDDETRKLESLKHMICLQTGDNISVNWETLINNLREAREKVLEEYKNKTSEIIGKIAVNNVIGDLRKAEDAKIIEGLKSRVIQDQLFQVTKRYKSIDLKGEKLVVSDSFDDFCLSDLSTGAMEQILLALRIGLSTKILKQDSLFLILDDAFQYSDWERRTWLMDKVEDLAKNDWQIIYFTMDDHIKELFNTKGKLFGNQYKMRQLKSY